jgi:hypothetical protein
MAWYYHAERGELREMDPAFYAELQAANNPKADGWSVLPDPQPGQYWNGTEWADPPVYVPQVVSRFQAKAALLSEGLLDQVEAIIADPATDAMTKLAWDEAVQFQRNSPTIATLAAALGLTDQQVDDLFIAAAQINI